MEKFRPQGYIDLLKLYMDRMLTKKTVALFNEFKAAHDDVMMELYTEYKVQADGIKAAIDNFTSMCDVEDWFNELGKRKG